MFNCAGSENNKNIKLIIKLQLHSVVNNNKKSFYPLCLYYVFWYFPEFTNINDKTKCF